MHLEYPECIFEIDEMNAIFDAEEVFGQKLRLAMVIQVLRDHQRQG